jgi:hypothetical protein
MGKKNAPDTAFSLEDYNQPTQPMERIIPPLITSSAYTASGWYSEATTTPANEWDGQSFSPGTLPAYPFYQLPASPVYPVLPPAAAYGKARGYPPGGSAPAYKHSYGRKNRRSPLPFLVRLFFIAIQLTLFARIVFMISGISANTIWLELLLGASDLFVLPVRLLVANINTSVLAGTELLIYLEFLLAILIYMLFSRLLVRCLRACL